MQPFRMAWSGASDARCAVQVVGHRQAFPEPVDAAQAPSWFCFLFHHPTVVLGGSGETTLPPGGFLLVGPGDRVHHRPAGGRLERSWLRCSGDDIAALAAEAGLPRRSCGPLARPGEALDALLAIHRACLHPAGTTAAHLRALVGVLLHVVARGTDEAPGRDGLAAARTLLESSFRLPPRLDELATRAGCSRAQFCRRFRTVVGCSPGAYVQRLRLETARELLQTTVRSIPDIAEACGFTDRFHFSRIFAHTQGCPPAIFRRNSKAH